MKDIKDLKILIDNKTLLEEIKKTAQEINNFYGTKETLTLICVLKGAVMYFSELCKYLKMPIKMEFVSLSSYGNNLTSTNEVKAINLNLPNFEGQNVLVVEDIIDTGLTLDFLINYIKKNTKAKGVKLVCMLDKKAKRKYDIEADFTTFEVEDKFIVGFGLDYQGCFRNLDYIGYFE